jgi:hypothetical protein
MPNCWPFSWNFAQPSQLKLQSGLIVGFSLHWPTRPTPTNNLCVCELNNHSLCSLTVLKGQSSPSPHFPALTRLEVRDVLSEACLDVFRASNPSNRSHIQFTISAQGEMLRLNQQTYHVPVTRRHRQWALNWPECFENGIVGWASISLNPTHRTGHESSS